MVKINRSSGPHRAPWHDLPEGLKEALPKGLLEMAVARTEAMNFAEANNRRVIELSPKEVSRVMEQDCPFCKNNLHKLIRRGRQKIPYDTKTYHVLLQSFDWLADYGHAFDH